MMTVNIVIWASSGFSGARGYFLPGKKLSPDEVLWLGVPFKPLEGVKTVYRASGRLRGAGGTSEGIEQAVSILTTWAFGRVWMRLHCIRAGIGS